MRFFLALGSLVLAGSAHAMMTSTIDIRPDAVHVDQGAVQITTTGSATVQPGALQASIAPGAFTATVQTGAFRSPLVSVPITAVVPKDAIEFTVQPKAFSIEVQPGAVVIHIEGSLLGDELSKPINEVKTVYEKRQLYGLMAGGVVLGLLLLCWFIHARGKSAVIRMLQQRPHN
jgi:hypothetical protein